MAITTDDLSGITTHNINIVLSNITPGLNYAASFDVTSPYTGLHTIEPTVYNFTGSSSSMTIPVSLRKNISVKLMTLSVTINNLSYNLSSSTNIIIRCSSFTGCS